MSQSQAVVRSQTPEEREYARYLIEIEARKRCIAELQADLESLKLTLARFEAEYHARVGVLFVELDRVRLAIAEYERRIALLHAHPDADPDEVERDISESFQKQREEIRDEEETTRRYQESHRREQERPAIGENESNELKRLYRDLAKRFHPDLARTDDEQRQRAATMRCVNAAFQNRDLEAMRKITREAEIEDPAFEQRTIDEKIVWAIRELARLDEMIAALTEEDDLIRKTPTNRLWERHESGEPVMEQLEADLNRDLATERDRLAALIGTYQHLVEERAM